MIERLLTRVLGVEEINGGNRCPTYLYRWTLCQPRRPRWFWRGFGVYLHKFVGDDWSRDLHDHPKRFISIGLRGRYLEWTPTPIDDVVGMGPLVGREFRSPWVRTFPAEHIHRLSPHRQAAVLDAGDRAALGARVGLLARGSVDSLEGLRQRLGERHRRQDEGLPVMPSCASVSCAEATTCAMVGGCINERFQRPALDVASEFKKSQRVLAGTEPTRPDRDPSRIKRKRKALRP